MALNHTHDILNTPDHDTKNKTSKSSTKSESSTKELKENNEHGDLLDGRTLLEAEALLIMMITRMKIKG